MEQLGPEEIEQRSFQIIEELLGGKELPKGHEHIIKRCIHTSADFDYADNLFFSPGVVHIISEAIKGGCLIIADTEMVKAGINKERLKRYGAEVRCFISDEDVAGDAKKRGTTRAAVAVEKAAKLSCPMVFAVGNAPTALIKLYELIGSGFTPAGIIAVPVGFVNVVESKELIMRAVVPCIVAKGRKGGSNIAAAICNAIIYDILY